MYFKLIYQNFNNENLDKILKNIINSNKMIIIFDDIFDC